VGREAERGYVGKIDVFHTVSRQNYTLSIPVFIYACMYLLTCFPLLIFFSLSLPSFLYYFLPKLAIEWLAFLLRLREGPGSNLGLKTGYPKVLHTFPQSHQANHKYIVLPFLFILLPFFDSYIRRTSLTSVTNKTLRWQPEIQTERQCTTVSVPLTQKSPEKIRKVAETPQQSASAGS
jgi:hypothetical protein